MQARAALEQAKAELPARNNACDNWQAGMFYLLADGFAQALRYAWGTQQFSFAGKGFASHDCTIRSAVRWTPFRTELLHGHHRNKYAPD